MKTCVKCNLSYEDDKKFCKKCGAALATVYSIPAKEIAKKTVFEDRLKADPLNVGILHEFARFLFANLLFDETIPVALKILALNEDDLPALETLCQSYVKLHKLKEAIEVSKQLLQIKPADIDLLTTLAEISLGMDHNKEALAYYDSALKLDPANKDTHFNKALILLKENELEKAIRSFKEAFALGNNDRITSIYLGIDKALNADYESAISQLTPVLTDSFVNPEDLNDNRGFLFLAFSLSKNSGDLSEIINWLNKCDLRILKTKHHPLDESAWVSTVKYIFDHRLGEAGLASEAKNKIDILAEIYLNKDYVTSKNYQTIAEIWYSIGKEQAELKLFEDAIKSFRKAVDLQPNEGKYKEAVNTAKVKIELEQKKKNRKTIISVFSGLAIVAIIIAAVFTFNYLQEKHTWEKSAQINTEASFQAYLDEYPEGKYKNEAINLKEEAVWNVSKSLNTIESYDYYLNNYASGNYIKEAENLKEIVYWNDILKLPSYDKFKRYYNNYPNGQYINKKIIDEKSFNVKGIIKFIGIINQKTNLEIGIGIFETNNDNWNGIYEGEWKGDKRSGIGIMNWTNSSKYDGNWQNNLMEGSGQMYYPDGSIYNGMWHLAKRSGYGVFTFYQNVGYGSYGGQIPRGLHGRCEGNWFNDHLNGNITCKSENKYDSTVYKGIMINGKGKLYSVKKYDGDYIILPIW